MIQQSDSTYRCVFVEKQPVNKMVFYTVENILISCYTEWKYRLKNTFSSSFIQVLPWRFLIDMAILTLDIVARIMFTDSPNHSP